MLAQLSFFSSCQNCQEKLSKLINKKGSSCELVKIKIKTHVAINSQSFGKYTDGWTNLHSTVQPQCFKCKSPVFHCLCLCLCHCHCFFLSGHVFLSLWSNVSKVINLKDCSLRVLYNCLCLCLCHCHCYCHCHCLCHCLFVGHVMSPRHSHHMSPGSQVSQSALW